MLCNRSVTHATAQEQTTPDEIATVQQYEFMLPVKRRTIRRPRRAQIVFMRQIEFQADGIEKIVCFFKSHMQHAFQTPCWHCKLNLTIKVNECLTFA